jgi:hypothetical protein
MLICLEFGYPMIKSAKTPRYPASKARKSSQPISYLTKPAVVPAFILFGLEFGDHGNIGNYTDFGRKQ